MYRERDVCVICMCVFVCIYIYIYTYIHTCTHMYNAYAYIHNPCFRGEQQMAREEPLLNSICIPYDVMNNHVS